MDEAVLHGEDGGAEFQVAGTAGFQPAAGRGLLELQQRRGGGSSSNSGKKVALLLPETKTTRYEAQDRPLFEAKVKALCGDCQILYSNANQDPAAQQNQADAALTNGAKVLVLDPVDSASAASIVAKAKARNVPVISHDRLILNSDVDYYISFDNVEVGKLQARSLVGKLRGTARAPARS